MTKKRVVIIGAGPAGLTCAYEFLKRTKDYEIIILEQDKQVGGISKTITYNNNKMDLGGHRFYSKNDYINQIWQEILPIQNENYGTNISIKKGNMEENDDVFLIRNRISRIYYSKKFFDYPISLSLKTIQKMGIVTTLESGVSYLKGSIFKRKETNLENFYINRFGKKLYHLFFERYTEKVWGRSPKDIAPDWGSQRVKGVSISTVLKNAVTNFFHLKPKEIETSLINQFYYPKYGPGQMWERMASIIEQKGGKIVTGAEVVKILKKKNKIVGLTYIKNDKKIELNGDIFISSMPLKDFIDITNHIPEAMKNIALHLPYRDFMTIGLVVKKLNLKNETGISTVSNIIPDCWIYIQEPDVLMGRIQIFNNWSPYLVADLEKTISLGLEYFCDEEDSLWNMTNEQFKDFAVSELERMEIVDRNDILDYHVERVKKAYPAYFDSYQQIDQLIEYLNGFDNFYPIGRNGQHRYNNMDHSMLTGIEVVNTILCGSKDKTKIWSVNMENEYLEGK